MTTNIEISIVVPVFHSEGTLDRLVDRLRETLLAMRLTYEIILVDDGSQDGSWAVLNRLQTASPSDLAAIRLMRNFGQHNAIMCGLRASRGAFVVTMDDDLQNPPEEIPKLYDAITDRKDDLVYGSYAVKQHGLFRNLGSSAVAWVFRTAMRSPCKPTSFRIIRRELVDAIKSFDVNYIYLDGLFVWASASVSTIPTEHVAREAGRSGYSFRKLVRLALNLFVNFSTFPLRMVFLVGIGTAALSMLATVIIILLALFDRSAPSGYYSIISSMMFFGGIQLVAIGLIGEYVGRILSNVNRKPQYVVRSSLSSPNHL